MKIVKALKPTQKYFFDFSFLTTTKSKTATLNFAFLLNLAETKNSRKMDRIAEQNKQTVEKFFWSVEQQKFEIIKEIFATEAQGFQPFAPEGFPNNLVGSEGFYKEFSGLTARFSRMRFPRQIYTTEDPNYIFMQFNGEMDLIQGGKYENKYLATFRFKDGKIIEYTEYFNPIVLAKAFGIPL
jgi:ketosteroid isomerase-like protein